MCQTWYLSLPVGTIFAFRINACATLQHLDDAELERELVAEDEKAQLMVGYVRDVSPNGLDFGILASSSHAIDDMTKIDSVARKGVPIYNVSKPRHILSRPRSRTHPIANPRGIHASSSDPWTGLTALRALKPDLHEQIRATEARVLALCNMELPLNATESLPWRRAFAYRPNLGDVSTTVQASTSTGSLRVPLRACHRFVVGTYSAAGAAARPQARFPRKEVERAEKIMNDLKRQEGRDREDKIRDYEQGMEVYSESLFGTYDSPTPGFSESEGEATLSSQGSFESVSLNDDNTNEGSRKPQPIVIDIFLDLESVKNLPSYPDDFERAVARLEKIAERSTE